MKTDLERWRERIFAEPDPIPEVLLVVNDKHYLMRNVRVKTSFTPADELGNEMVTLSYVQGEEAGQAAADKDAEALQAKIERAGDSDDPLRDRIVVRIGDEYYATYRWEINPDNGWVTVQLRDGSILPTQPHNWEVYSIATDEFGIERSDIKVDDPDRE